MKKILSLLPEEVRELFHFFDSNGLAHNLSYLEKIKSKIPFWELERQARFADEVTYRMNKKDAAECVLSLFMDIKEIDFRIYNATSVGNIAFITFNTENKQVRDAGHAILTEVREYYSQFK